MAELKTKKEKPKQERIKEPEDFEIKEILVRTDKDENFAMQIRLTTVDGEDITYRPKNKKVETTTKKGLKFTKTYKESISLEELPEKCYKLNELIQKHKTVRILTTYGIFIGEDDAGELIGYKYLNEHDWETMYPIDKDNKEIKI